jgi:7,8-dihydro-6-hydroxymethylpterin-pyrophosphokinase
LGPAVASFAGPHTSVVGSNSHTSASTPWCTAQDALQLNVLLQLQVQARLARLFQHHQQQQKQMRRVQPRVWLLETKGY